jgi:hypothetical protein
MHDIKRFEVDELMLKKLVESKPDKIARVVSSEGAQFFIRVIHKDGQKAFDETEILDPWAIFAAILAEIGKGALQAVGAAIVNRQLQDLGLVNPTLDKVSFETWMIHTFLGEVKKIVLQAISEADIQRLEALTAALQERMKNFILTPQTRIDDLGIMDSDSVNIIAQLRSNGLQALPAYAVAVGDRLAILQERYKWLKDEGEKQVMSNFIDDHTQKLGEICSDWRNSINTGMTVEPSIVITGRFGGKNVEYLRYFGERVGGPYDFSQASQEHEKTDRDNYIQARQSEADTIIMPTLDLCNKLRQFKTDKLPNLKPDDVSG